jgi:hypothetical protein
MAPVEAKVDGRAGIRPVVVLGVVGTRVIGGIRLHHHGRDIDGLLHHIAGLAGLLLVISLQNFVMRERS